MVGKEWLLYSGSLQLGKVVDECLKDRIPHPGKSWEKGGRGFCVPEKQVPRWLVVCQPDPE